MPGSASDTSAKTSASTGAKKLYGQEAARRSETFIGAKHRARLARMDTPVAIKATARDLACLIYVMVTEGQEYVEQGIEAHEKRRLNRKFAHLDRQARKLGLQLVPAPQNNETKKPLPSAAQESVTQERPTAVGSGGPFTEVKGLVGVVLRVILPVRERGHGGRVSLWRARAPVQEYGPNRDRLLH